MLRLRLSMTWLLAHDLALTKDVASAKAPWENQGAFLIGLQVLDYLWAALASGTVVLRTGR